MPTNDPIKNREFVKKSQAKKKALIGADEFNRIHNEKQAIYRQNLINQKGIEQVRREKAEYMKAYRLKKKQEKKQKNDEEENKNKNIIKIQSAIRNRIAVNDVARRYVDKRINLVNKSASLIQNNLKIKLAKKELEDRRLKKRVDDAVENLLNNKATTIQSNYRIKLAKKKNV
jgi:hypothetical protein